MNQCVECLGFHIQEVFCESMPCYICGETGHSDLTCLHKERRVYCYKCGKRGHKIYDCQVLLCPEFETEETDHSKEKERAVWLQEEMYKAICPQCGSKGHTVCKNSYVLFCRADKLYKNKNPQETAAVLYSAGAKADKEHTYLKKREMSRDELLEMYPDLIGITRNTTLFDK